MIKNSGYNLRFSLLFGGHLCIIKQRFLERSIERNRNMSASVRSMTGYGRGEHIAEERKFTVEMKSVNHRYNDMTIKLPRSLAGLEDKIKKESCMRYFAARLMCISALKPFRSGCRGKAERSTGGGIYRKAEADRRKIRHLQRK